MERYEEVKALGKGSFGAVFSMRERTTRRSWVMKKIKLPRDKRWRQAAFQEAKLLQQLRHPHICSYHDSFVDKPTNQLCVVMTFCPGGDLHARIKSHKKRRKQISEADVVKWFAQLCLALVYIHERHSVIHRDIKSQNIFLMDDDSIKLGDFGVSRVLDKPTDLAKTCVGSPFYMCPELMRKQRYSNKADMWALGCVLYELTTLRHPFDARDMNGLLAMKIVRGNYPPLPSTYTRALRGAVADLLATSPAKRPSATALLGRPLLHGIIAQMAAAGPPTSSRPPPTRRPPRRRPRRRRRPHPRPRRRRHRRAVRAPVKAPVRAPAPAPAPAPTKAQGWGPPPPRKAPSSRMQNAAEAAKPDAVRAKLAKRAR